MAARSDRMVNSSRQMAIFILAGLLLPCLPSAFASEFDMIFQTKCIFHEISFETSIKGSFRSYLKDNDNSQVHLTIRVEDPLGEEIFAKVGVAQADFHLPDVYEGEYKVCFTANDYHTAQSTRITLKWEEGVDATDWEMVAKRDNLDTVHTELLRLEDSVHDIHLELQHIRRKEEQMRDINERTNSRIAWFSIGALFTCVGMAVLQLWSLRKFFIRKKIL